MKCKCGFNNIENSMYCSKCGKKLNEDNKIMKIPEIVTVKEAYEIIFKGKISVSQIYCMIREKSLPHVSAGGKLLLDVEQTIKWWNQRLSESTITIKTKGLRKIV